MVMEPLKIEFLKSVDRELAEGTDSFCGWALKARRGEDIYIDERNVSCPLAKFKLGYGRVPDLEEILVGWGDASTVREAKLYLDDTVTLKNVKIIHLAREIENPDLIIYFGKPDEIMRLVRRYSSQTGKRIMGRVSGVGAMCGELCAFPYVTNQPNLSVGCGGSRSRVFGKDEIAVSFPIRRHRI